MIRADVVVDLQYGDCGKGKVVHSLLRDGKYTHCIRFNGGCNAGHTIFHDGKKYITHHIPAGVFYGIRSIIGPGCVVNIDYLMDEIEELEQNGISVRANLKIAANAHVITNKHIKEEQEENKIGTTRRGNGPAYRDKYARTGKRAKSTEELQDYIIDMYDEFYEDHPDAVILFEGAQGFGLDIDHGDYPFVSSSHCTTAGALLNGFPPQCIDKIIGVCKPYQTYVGAKEFQPKDPVFDQLREIGGEFGATTGRPRQCNWFDLDMVKKAIRMNGVTDLVINKMDILKELDKWNIIGYDGVMDLESHSEFKSYMNKVFGGLGVRTYFSYHPDKI